MFLEIVSLFFLGHLHNAGKVICLGYGTLEDSYLLQVIPFPAHIEVSKCIFRDIYKGTIIMSISQRILFLFEIEVCQVRWRSPSLSLFLVKERKKYSVAPLGFSSDSKNSACW